MGLSVRSVIHFLNRILDLLPPVAAIAQKIIIVPCVEHGPEEQADNAEMTDNRSHRVLYLNLSPQGTQRDAAATKGKSLSTQRSRRTQRKRRFFGVFVTGENSSRAAAIFVISSARVAQWAAERQVDSARLRHYSSNPAAQGIPRSAGNAAHPVLQTQDTPSVKFSSDMVKTLLVIVYLIWEIIALPGLLIWGWVRWVKQSKPRTWFSAFSLTGLVLATASALLAVSTVLYAQAVGGFPYYDPRLLRFYRWGGMLSLAGLLFALGGVWRPGPIRWHALVGSVGMLVFWAVAAAGE